MNDIRTNTLIIGCGIAGATAALRLSDDPNQHITIITRAPDAVQSNTGWSQGGIVTRGLDNSPDLLVKDILHAGAGLSSPRAARILAEEGPRLVNEVLIDRCGVKFDRDESDELVYGLEAAHSTRRIVHVGDKTGNAIIIQLLATLAERSNVTLLTDHTAVDLITFPHHSLDPLDAYEPMTCHGAYVLDRERKEIVRVLAAQTILATGGLGQLYRNTSNPKGARGDGLAMAWRAGARIVNAEYVQFHPTTLSVRGAPNLLISEAVRGEGAALLDPQRQAVHAALRSGLEGTRPARRGRPRDPHGDARTRLRTRLPRHRQQARRRLHPRALPAVDRDDRALSASIRPPSRSRSSRRRTTSAAACWSMTGDAPISPDCTPSAR